MSWLLALGLAWGAGLPPCTDQQTSMSIDLPTVGTGRWAARLALRAWQLGVSPADGARCNFYPSCSAYALESVRRYGPVVGVVMAAERLQRPHSGWQYPLCEVGGRRFYVDLPQDHAPRRAR